MSDTEGTQSGKRSTGSNRVDHLPGSDRDTQFPSLSRVTTRIVKPRTSGAGGASDSSPISPGTQAEAVLDSLEWTDADAVSYLYKVRDAAGTFDISLATLAFPALNWAHCQQEAADLLQSIDNARDNIRSMLGSEDPKPAHHCQNLSRLVFQQQDPRNTSYPSLWPGDSDLGDLASRMTDDFEKLSGMLLNKLNKINGLDTDKTSRILAELTRIGHHPDLTGKTRAALREAEAFLGMAVGDYSAYSLLVRLDMEPAQGSSKDAEQESADSQGTA
jgi:hypothetical protein